MKEWIKRDEERNQISQPEMIVGQDAEANVRIRDSFVVMIRDSFIYQNRFGLSSKLKLPSLPNWGGSTARVLHLS
jgi:hypothetical protein